MGTAVRLQLPQRRRRIDLRGVLAIAAVLAGGVRAIPAAEAPSSDPVRLFHEGRLEAARGRFAERLTERPDDPEALYYLGRLTQSAGEGRRFFQRLLATHPTHDLADDALFELAEADYADPLGLYLTARRNYRRLIADYPLSPMVPLSLYRIGRTYLVAGHVDSAARHFRRVIAEFPASPARSRAERGLAESEGAAGQRHLARARVESLAVAGRGRTTEGSPAPSVDRRYWVQVGAFENGSNARRLAQRLDRAGYRLRRHVRR